VVRSPGSVSGITNVRVPPMRRRRRSWGSDGTLIVLDELAKTLERVLDRVDEMRKRERSAA
jgi:hypothetical protein